MNKLDDMLREIIKQAEAASGWYCPVCQRGVRPEDVTWEAHHTECGAGVIISEEGIVSRLARALRAAVGQRDKMIVEVFARMNGIDELGLAAIAKDLDDLKITGILDGNYKCPDCDGDGDLGAAPDWRLIACETCGGHEDSLGTGKLPPSF